jgi:aromatic-amino-acid transaminase
MFAKMEMAPADPILGLTDAFKKETNPDKVNLGVGVYKDASGQTPVFTSVKKAEAILLKEQTTKGYLPITGDAAYGTAVQKMLFGQSSALIGSGKAATAHTPGGTGALRVAGDFFHVNFSKSALWLSNPTWANHNAIFAAAGVETKQYNYYDAAKKTLDFDALLASVHEIPEGDIILLHGCCHNPTGVDPSAEQWATLADAIKARGIFPLFDFAYQGLAKGIEEDAIGLRLFVDKGVDLAICSSFSKNFSLYCERVGSITLLTKDAQVTANAFSHVKLSIRRNYSSPPSHGGAIVAIILNDEALKAEWEGEVADIRNRIAKMRALFVTTLQAKGATGDFSFITAQNGMFSFSGLNKEQVGVLKLQHAIYIVGSGRINVAGLTADNIDATCEAIAAVL